MASTNGRAYAETTVTDEDIAQTEQKVAENSATYNAAESEIARLEEEQLALESQIAQLTDALPAQQASASQAVCSLYKMSRETSEVLELIFGANSLQGFLQVVEGLNTISDYYYEKLASLNSTVASLQEAQERTVQAREEAEAQRDVAYASLVESQQLHQELQAKQNAERAAQEDAEAAAAAAAAAQEIEAQEASGSADEQAQDTNTEVTAGPSDDGADWSSDEAVFVNEWAGRIDSYLAGSPLAGQGKTFAQAAWDYGVDPRWSPAISCLESSKGAYCFLPHNAWGWGSCSWDSWEEAIRDHVRGLGRYYGYTITPEHARTYCPPNWEYWYAFVSAQMDKI